MEDIFYVIVSSHNLPMLPVEICNMTLKKNATHMLFELRANGIPLAASCTLQEFHENHDKTMEKVNENFRNSIRYIKLYKDLPKNPDKKKLSVWTSTNTGVSVRGNKLPLPEFKPFDL